MQTFLPYKDFDRSARVLSSGKGGHLSNQRNEALIILKSCLSPYGGWPNHAATRMWRGHEYHLVLYIEALQKECVRREIAGLSAFNDALIINSLFNLPKKAPAPPPWLGDRAFHRAHQSNLVRKQPEHYRKFFPRVSDDLPYVWPEGNK